MALSKGLWRYFLYLSLILIVIPFSGIDRVKGLENYEDSPKIIIDKSFVSDDRCDVGSTQTIGFHAKWTNNNSNVVNCVIYIEDESIHLFKKIFDGKKLNLISSTFERFGDTITEWTRETSYRGNYSVKLIIPKGSLSGSWAILKVPYSKTLKTLDSFSFYIKYVNARPRFAIYLDKNGDKEVDSILLSDYLNFGNDKWTMGTGGLRWGWTEASYPPFEYGKVWNSYKYWKDKYGEMMVLYVAIALEYWAVEPEGLGEPLYVDTVTINEVTFDLEPSKIIIKNLKPGQKVELYNDLGVLKSYGVVEEGMDFLELDVSDLTFPFKGYFEVYSTDGVTLLYTTPVYNDIWGGDVYYASRRRKLVTDETGWVYFNESLSSVGRKSWRVVGVDCNGVTAFEQTASSPSIIWDRVNLRLSVERSRVDVGSKAPIRVEGVYEYDGAPFQGSVVFNDSLIKSEVGRYGYRVVGISDPLYGLSVFNSNDVSVIFDRVNIKLSVDDSRIDVGESLPYSWVGEYEYDGSRFEGSITLNDTVIKDDVGRYVFTVASISDERYGLTAFSANAIDCIWDRIVIVNGGVSKETTSIGKMETVWFKALYEYDKETFTGEDGVLYVNGEPMIWSSHDEIWKYTAVREKPGSIRFEVTGVEDRRYGLTVIEDLVGPATIEWQRPFWQEPICIILIGGGIITTILFMISSMKRRDIL